MARAKAAAAAAAQQEQQAAAQWRSRIVGHELVAPDQLLAHPFNWRIHGAVQQRLTEGALDDLGWIDEVTVNRLTGRVINGHLRVSLAMRRNEPLVPVRYVELSEEEELRALRSLQLVASLAALRALQFLLESLNPLEAGDDA